MVLERIIIIGLALLVLFIVKKAIKYEQPDYDKTQHEITIFAIPSAMPISWESPSELYTSTLKCYLSSIFRKTYYVIGHMSARISSPLLKSPEYVGMTGSSQIEKIQQVLINRMGLGVFGATLKGKMEPVEKIHKTTFFYAKRNKLGTITFKVNEEAIRRSMRFIEYFKTKNEFGYAPCELYNGALNPRYRYEGAACSSFIIALMDVAGILPAFAAKEWAVNLNLPMNLIGGKLNQQKRISLKSIIRTHDWHDGSGIEGVDYARLELYDPALVYNWIQEQRAENNAVYEPIDNGVFKGVQVSKNAIEYKVEQPILKAFRIRQDFFVKNFMAVQLNGHITPKTQLLPELQAELREQSSMSVNS